MATNFAYRKRQLELEKKRKKEEKLKRKQELKASGGAPDPDDEGFAESEDTVDTAGDAASADPSSGTEQGTQSSEGTVPAQPER